MGLFFDFLVKLADPLAEVLVCLPQ